MKFWNSMYFDFGHGTHVLLLKNFIDGLEGFNFSKMIQVSMDSPSVKLKFLEVPKKFKEESDLPKLIDIGSCNLHVVYGAFKTGAESTSWNIKSFKKCAFQLPKDYLTRREDFITITGSPKLPLQFCSTR